MPSTFRIPEATMSGPYARLLQAYARRTWGQVPDNAYVALAPPQVMNAVLGFERKVARWDALDPHLASFAQMASAAVIGCSWCLDFGYFLAHDEGLDEAKVREVPRWRESDVFTPLERDVLEYAEAMSVTPPDRRRRAEPPPPGRPRRQGRRRAHPARRAREHALALQQRRRPRGAGLLGGLRAAAGRTLARMSEGPDAAEFEALRPLLFTVAYEMLEVAADAEDVVQEAWLRWSRVDPTTVRDPRAYLVRVVIRLSLNRFRTVSRQRETYVGPWLPEPLLTVPDVADDVELADSVSTAMLLVLQTLTPVERAVFVLREVFDVPYDEIAQGVDRTPAAVRQIAHRAREHVAARRPRRRVDRERARGGARAVPGRRRHR